VVKTLQQLGEDRVVAELLKTLHGGSDVIVGAGDDCAVLGKKRDRFWRLLKTDAVVEGIHFLPGEKMQRVGWKALCRTISDIAAMGGTPEHALVTLAVAPTMEMRRLSELYRGFKKAARQYGVSIVGGETSRSPGPLFVSVALTGRVERTQCVLRSGGRAGDFIYVTGRLGGSLAGKHLDFHPRVEEGRWLTEHFRLRAMMDVSDGIAADLPRLAKASKCGFTLHAERVPRQRGCTVAQALNDGEDFELLFAIAPADATALESRWERRFPRVPLTRIGELTRRPIHDSRSSTLHGGFDHFAQP
jgi:thiamine-monophosphate kinase